MTFITVIGNGNYTVYAEEITKTTYEKVTSASEVLAGGDFVVAAGAYVVSTIGNGTKQTRIPVTVEGNKLYGDNVPTWNINAVDGTKDGISLGSDGKYLKYTGTSTNITLAKESYTWILKDNQNGDFEILETTTAEGSNPRELAINLTAVEAKSVGAYAASNKSDEKFIFVLSLLLLLQQKQ